MSRPLLALLIAGEESQADVAEGRKKITIREGHRDYDESKVMLCCPETSFCVEAQITDVRHCYARDLTAEELRADGYQSVEHAVLDLRRFYPKFTKDSEVTVVRWDNVRGMLAD